jgi:hypothetical protein
VPATGGDAPGPDAPPEDVRWEETDPLGYRVVCTEATWADKVAARAELADHEQAVRDTIRDPDYIYLDVEGTVTRRLRGGPQDVVMVHYVSWGRTHGKQAGNRLVAVVKWMGPSSPDAGRGYFTTALMPSRAKSGLELRWSRPP